MKNEVATSRRRVIFDNTNYDEQQILHTFHRVLAEFIADLSAVKFPRHILSFCETGQ